MKIAIASGALYTRSVFMEKEQVIRQLKAQLHVNGHIIGASVGSGMTARLAALGGADFLLALSAGKYW